MTAAFRIEPVGGAYAVCRLGGDEPVPEWAQGGRFTSVTRTPEELSVVVEEARVPPGVRHEAGFAALRVAGSLDFSLVGVLSALTAPLAAAGVSVFAVSTFDTDYLLVRVGDHDRAVAALEGAGHTVAGGRSDVVDAE